ncbi:MAG: hypothetical protein LBM65_02720, partial [Oscillospiraceae bacterium]|nr:hypothetical protein [Oscillospiraceae bacterium]
MKLYIKRDTSDLLARFSVLDEQCKEKYLVLGSRSPSGEKLVITDTQGEKLLKIKKIPLPVLHAFSIGNKEENFKLIVNLSAKSSTCYYYGISWRIRGDISTGSYDIIDADGTVVASHIKRFSAC